MMRPIEGQPILTAAQMRAAEERAAPTPEAVYALMERAGAGVADTVRRLAAGAEVLILCGPGNNGGDGYVAARVLREWGLRVRVAALMPPRTDLARRAAAAWGEPVALYATEGHPAAERSPWDGADPAAAPVLVDALFGTGATFKHGDYRWIERLRPLFGAASLRIAVDLPLGLSADGNLQHAYKETAAGVTLALGALKPAHVLPGAPFCCGEIRVIDLGLHFAEAPVRVIERPVPPPLGPGTHKFTRGMVGVVAGPMPGAARLAAMAAARAGAGYVALFGEAGETPAAVVRQPLTIKALSDPRLDVVVVGPGLGRDDRARDLLEALLHRRDLPLVVDGDALHLLDPALLTERDAPTVLTPHQGEFQALMARTGAWLKPDEDFFGTLADWTGALAPGAALVLVHKGPTTTVTTAAQARVSPRGSAWLSTAGAGDVLAGAVAAQVAAYRHADRPMLDAAAAGVWLQAEAARRCGASFIADDLAYSLTAARASL